MSRGNWTTTYECADDDDFDCAAPLPPVLLHSKTKGKGKEN